jgi:hypothetical protein
MTQLPRNEGGLKPGGRVLNTNYDNSNRVFTNKPEFEPYDFCQFVRYENHLESTQKVAKPLLVWTELLVI